ncbi:MAG TPA: hypothetical protein VND64_16620, partial [Pirellulales bacterium]|nr:hypothetical protein [Pirellulales bacterium]
YYANSVLRVSSRPHRTLFGHPESLFVVLMFTWGILWFVDTLVRPRQETLVAASLFLIFLYLFIEPLAHVP